PCLLLPRAGATFSQPTNGQPRIGRCWISSPHKQMIRGSHGAVALAPALRKFVRLYALRFKKACHGGSPMTQSFDNHARFVPAFHFFILPVFLLNMFWSIYRLIQSFS